MTDKNETNKPREVKVYFTPTELDEIESFRMESTTLKSRNHLFHVAIDYYMEMVKRSGGVLTGKGFPVQMAAESPSEYRIRGRTEHKK
jgi:hypothetical protein